MFVFRFSSPMSRRGLTVLVAVILRMFGLIKVAENAPHRFGNISSFPLMANTSLLVNADISFLCSLMKRRQNSKVTQLEADDE